MKKPTLASRVASVAFLAISIGIITVLVYLSGTKGIAVHFYYIPIIYAGYAFGDYGAIIVCLLSAALCGPWVPAEIAADTRVAQTQYDVLLRALIFYVIGIAASRASLELKRRIHEARNLYDVARSVTSSLRLRQVLNLITDHAVEVMDANACAIRLLKEDTKELELAAQHGLSEEYAQKGPVSLSSSQMDQVVLGGELLQMSDVGNDERWQYPEAALREGIHAVLSVPLVSKGRPLGVIRIYDSRIRRFKPREIELLQAFADQAAVAIENAALYEDLRDAYYETVRALTIAIEARDSATYSHSERVTDLAERLADFVGIEGEELEMLRFGATLHDIGKIGVAEGYLDSREGPAETQVFYRMHPLIGRSILQPISFLAPVIPIVVAHHEHWDGSGFPQGMKGTDIPRTARIVGLVDRYERLINPEAGVLGLSPKEALEEVTSEAGSRFDPQIVAAFRRMMKNPAGDAADETVSEASPEEAQASASPDPSAGSEE